MNIISKTFLILGVTFSVNISAAIYQCEIDGVVTFSDKPCGNKSEKIKVKAHPHSQQAHSETVDAPVQSTQDYLQEQRIKREILDTESRIKGYKTAMDAEITALQQRSASTTNNLAGAEHSKAAATEMEAVVKRYSSLIELENNTLQMLHDELTSRDASSETNVIKSDFDKQRAETRNYIEKKKLDREINNHEAKIKRYRNKMNAEISALKQKSSYANDNVAGATWKQSLATEMGAISSKYNVLIDTELRQLDILKQKRLSIADQ